MEIAFYGAGAIISGLDPQSSLWFQVRAVNAHGVSDWSEMLYTGSTSQYKQGRRARRANAPATGAPVIVGRAQAGPPLWANTTGIEDRNGLDRVWFDYQWMSNDGNGDTDITGATQPSYLWSDAEEGKSISVRVSFIDRLGYAESRTSASVSTVAAAPAINNAATGAPTISGTAQVGQMLTAHTSGITDSDGLTNVGLRVPVAGRLRTATRSPRSAARHGRNLHPAGDRRGRDDQGEGEVQAMTSTTRSR